MDSPPPNYYQGLTTPSKLRGQYYTPDELVAMILDGLHLAPQHRVIDPACGDGSFLRGVVAAVARRFRGADRRALAKEWSGRLIGFDVNGAAVAEAREGLREAFGLYLGVDVSEDSLRVYQADVLCYPQLGRLLQAVGAPRWREGERLLVIGNPPYVEAKRLPREKKEALKARYPEAVVGAPDLYLYFLHVCLGWLRPADTLAFVLPNKLLVNANAQTIRERLLEKGRLRALWFATQATIFPGTAVYPIVLFAGGRRPGHPAGVEIARITRTPERTISQGEKLTIDAAAYRRTSARAFYPPPETPVLQDALESLLRQAETSRLGDVLDIRWTVSFHRAGLRERYVLPHRPDDLCVRPFIGGGPFSGNGEVTRYRLQWAGWWIRYDAAALQADRNSLPDLSLFERPKVAICQNGRTLRAAYDDQGYVLKDTFLCGSLREIDHPLCRDPRAIVGLLCSRAIHFFYSHVFYGGHVNGGYLHFLRSFLVDIPLGTWSDTAAEALAALVKQREEAGPPRQWEELEEQIEAYVADALGLMGAHQHAIREWAVRDPNWPSRDRVRPPAAPTPARAPDSCF
jgi:hypothetical protein